MRNVPIYGDDFETVALESEEAEGAESGRVQIDFDLRHSASVLEEEGLEVDIVEYDQDEVSDYLRSARRNVLSFNRMYSLNKISTNPALLTRIVDGRSNYQAQAENYVGYGMPLWHFLMMNGLGGGFGVGSGRVGQVPTVGKRVVKDLRELFFKVGDDGVERPARFLELCGGNCDVSKNLAGRWGKIERWHNISELINRKKFKGQIDEIRNLAMSNILSTLSPPLPTPNIIALDYTKEFLDILNNKGIQTSHTDLCLPPTEFAKKSEIPPHSVDYMSLFMALDRLQNLNNAIQNIKSLALKDGSTKILIGTILPLSNKSDRHNIRDIPQITYWDPSAPDEPRTTMMHSRAQALTNLAIYLKQNGITPKRFGWQNYEVVSLDSITATAGELRDRHSHTLQTLTFRDPELARLRDAILRGEFPPDKLVCFPQEYELVLLGCDVHG